jgi:hypothetical protein
MEDGKMELEITTVADGLQSAELERPLALTALERARAFAVIDENSYVAAREFINEMFAKDKHWEEAFAKPKSAAYQAHQSICKLESSIRGPYKEAREIVEPRALKWYLDREALRLAEERRKQAEADKREEEERLAQALELEQQGEVEAAEEILSTPAYTPPVTVAREQFIPKTSGAIKENWTARVTNLMALVRSVAEGKTPIQAICANETFLNGRAREIKKKGTLFPGVEVYSKSGIVGSRR